MSRGWRQVRVPCAGRESTWAGDSASQMLSSGADRLIGAAGPAQTPLGCSASLLQGGCVRCVRCNLHAANVLAAIVDGGGESVHLRLGVDGGWLRLRERRLLGRPHAQHPAMSSTARLVLIAGSSGSGELFLQSCGACAAESHADGYAQQ